MNLSSISFLPVFLCLFSFSAQANIAIVTESSCASASSQLSVPSEINFSGINARPGFTFFAADMSNAGNSTWLKDGALFLSSGEGLMKIGQLVSETNECIAKNKVIDYFSVPANIDLTIESHAISGCFNVTSDGVFGYWEETRLSILDNESGAATEAAHKQILTFNELSLCRAAQKSVKFNDSKNKSSDRQN